MSQSLPGARVSRRVLLAANPFWHPYTIGFFYREKLRAIHRVAPQGPLGDILEVGGGESGLAALLYPGARIVNVDLDPAVAGKAVNRGPHIRFVRGDATRLPFPDATFDAVMLCDVLEHIPDDRAAAAEARRVVKPGGYLIASSPHVDWRYPYYKVLTPVVPTEAELFAEWGHVRRGYTLDQFDALLGPTQVAWASFISPVTALAHDLSFSKLPFAVKWGALVAISPLTWAGYLVHAPHGRGTEIAAAYRKVA